jgi:hypothetical protein
VACSSANHSSHDKLCPEYRKQADLLALRDPNGEDELFRLSALDRQTQWRVPSIWESAMTNNATGNTEEPSQETP